MSVRPLRAIDDTENDIECRYSQPPASTPMPFPRGCTRQRDRARNFVIQNNEFLLNGVS
jgi:hypothetical protein